MDAEMSQKMVTCYYLSAAFGPTDGLVARWTSALDHAPLKVRNALKRKPVLIGRGLSGAVVIPRLAEALGLPWAIVRKEGDGSHSSYPVEGAMGSRFLFVDDLIASGTTFKATSKAYKEAAAKQLNITERSIRCIGAFLYAPGIEGPRFSDSPDDEATE